MKNNLEDRQRQNGDLRMLELFLDPYFPGIHVLYNASKLFQR